MASEVLPGWSPALIDLVSAGLAVAGGFAWAFFVVCVLLVLLVIVASVDEMRRSYRKRQLAPSPSPGPPSRGPVDAKAKPFFSLARVKQDWTGWEIARCCLALSSVGVAISLSADRSIRFGPGAGWWTWLVTFVIEAGGFAVLGLLAVVVLAALLSVAECAVRLARLLARLYAEAYPEEPKDE